MTKASDLAEAKAKIMSLEETLISMWRQVLAKNAGTVNLDNETFPVRRSSKSLLGHLHPAHHFACD